MTKSRGPRPPPQTPSSATTKATLAGRLREAIALHQQGQLGPASALYGEVLRSDPENADALHFLGLLEAHRGQPEAGVGLITRSLGLNPRNAAAHCNRGNALLDLGRIEAALQDFDEALQIEPALAEALNSRGNALLRLGRTGESVASYESALAVNPRYPEALFNLGNALHQLDRYDEALASQERAIALRPGYVAALASRGSTLHALGRVNEALASEDTALSLRPDFVPALMAKGHVLQGMGRVEAGLACFEKALAAQPGNVETLVRVGNALTDVKQFDRALACYDRALAIIPEYPHLLGNHVHTRMKVCDWRDLQRDFERIAVGLAAGKPLISPFAALGTPLSLPLQKTCAELLVAAKFPAMAAAPARPPTAGHERIHLGYFSADLFSHATAYLMAGLFEHHDRSRFVLTAFSFGPHASDPMRTRIAAAFDRFIDVSAKSDAQVAALARQLGIDIAVDLKGFTQDGRTGIFARRAAPVQVSYLGYPGTMGAPYIDYLVADPLLIPPEHRQHYTEKVAYLPHTYQCNDATRAIADAVLTREDAGLPAQGFVFCCFNNNWKITPEVFDTWMRLLHRVPASVLWLIEDNPTAGRNLRTEAAKRGITVDRLVFAPRMANAEHLARHRLADLFLDTLPYNAHTTASDALWAGLPVLTCRGNTFAARVAASLLHAVGLDELITDTAADFEALAVELANDASRLAAIRQRLADNRLSRPLFNTALFTQHIETAYMEMWQRHAKGLPPDHIFVPA